MPVFLNTEDLNSPLGSLENTLDIIKNFYNEERFEDMDNAKKLIKDYENAIALLSRVVEKGGAR
ncbi:hypothetical protein D8824_05245 [Streptococcus intermedius]|nr:hypothetical protein [Streptococcus intermedius]RSJ09709.1 hypothetical protein D8833_07660 [Streptococcus intermedius]RSJ16134.1 hypothetical protein D8831_05245 [Streptococcus intermedius]RSJ30883.1 hypothetical protein D8824_05245 [Streptococcus intermedius]